VGLLCGVKYDASAQVFDFLSPPKKLISESILSLSHSSFLDELCHSSFSDETHLKNDLLNLRLLEAAYHHQ
jgi:hypothetical protein